MKRLFFICLIVSSSVLFAQQESKIVHQKTFKMDSITLKEYYFVMLSKGPKRKEAKDTAVINKLQDGQHKEAL